MSQITATTTSGPASTRICHIPCFNTSPKERNVMKMWDAGDVFLRDLMQVKRWMEKGVRKRKGKVEKWEIQ